MSYNMEFVDDLKELIDILEYESTNTDKALFNSAKKILNKLAGSDISNN